MVWFSSECVRRNRRAESSPWHITEWGTMVLYPNTFARMRAVLVAHSASPGCFSTPSRVIDNTFSLLNTTLPE